MKIWRVRFFFVLLQQLIHKLFKEKVEKHNETFAVTLEEEDDDVVDDEILTFEEEI